MNPLSSVTFHLPNVDHQFNEKLLKLLAVFGTRSLDGVLFQSSSPDFLPAISLSFEGELSPSVTFDSSDCHLEIPVVNSTEQERMSPETYQPIPLDEFVRRINDINLVRLDHVGFNLPWFDGVHPDILRLRKIFANTSAYFRFPTGEKWDFILPATKEEIETNSIDLSTDRHPKLEIVSFEKSSTPLIQFDCSARCSFNEIVTLFPEGIIDRELKNVWIYIENPYGVDVCFVIGEHQDGDWSEFFSGHRLTLSPSSINV